jgi:hypothetical protein
LRGAGQLPLLDSLSEQARVSMAAISLSTLTHHPAKTKSPSGSREVLSELPLVTT